MKIQHFALSLLAFHTTPILGFVRMSCWGRVSVERADPIVNPGLAAGHVHAISGGDGFGFNMTYEQARASTCSSCEIKEDFSNYWTPQMYYHDKNANTFEPVPIKGAETITEGGQAVYYLQRGPKTDQLKAFPPGFRMLAGDSMKRNFTGDLAAQAVNYFCDGANKPETNNLPDYQCPGGIRAQIFFPACWDGVNLDSPDHKSHVSYPDAKTYNNGPCPASHPVHLVSIFYEVFYDTSKFEDRWTDGHQPFVFANGDSTGYGFHGDFVNGWDINALQNLIDTCTDDSGKTEKCGAVTMYTTDEQKACRLQPLVQEKIDGVLNALPGCNPVTDGPEPATKVTCEQPQIGAFASYYTDLTASKSWSYQGCYTETPTGRILTGEDSKGQDMTIDKCLDYCSSNGFDIAGLEWSEECYCGSSIPASSAPAPGTTVGKCDHKCKGNGDQICGGDRALSVYKKCASGSDCKNNVPDPGTRGALSNLGSSGNTNPAPALSASPSSSSGTNTGSQKNVANAPAQAAPAPSANVKVSAQDNQDSLANSPNVKEANLPSNADNSAVTTYINVVKTTTIDKTVLVVVDPTPMARRRR